MYARVPVLFFPGFIFCVWLLVLTLRLIPLGGQWGDISAFTWIVVFVWMSVYFSAMIVGVLQRSRPSNSNLSSFHNIGRSSAWVARLSVLSIVGAILIAYEFAITRGYGFSTSVSSIREMEVNAAIEGFGGSWVSGLGRMLTPALMTAWVLAVLNWKQVGRNSKVLLLIASLAVFIQQFMYEGGRFYIAALLSMIFIASKFSKDPVVPKTKVSFNFKRFLWIVLAIFVFMGFCFVFVRRYRDAGRDFYEAYTMWAEVFDLKIDDATVYSRLNGDGASLWLGITMIWAYVTQGFNELNVLLLSESTNKAWGLFQFAQIGMVLGKLVDSGLTFNRLENLPHVGTYFTFYGASYVDFGHFGALIFIGLTGWLTGWSIKSLRNGNQSGLALNAPLLITLGVFAPIVSLVTNLWPAFFWAVFFNLARFRIAQVSITNDDPKVVVD
jgi:hypothetical protein